MGVNLPAIVSAGSSLFSSIFGGGGDPTDAERARYIDAMYQAAMTGDAGALDVLRCWAGSSTPPGPNHAATVMRVLGVQSTGSGCGMKTATSRAYALTRYNEAQARLAGGEILRDVAVGAGGLSTQVDPNFPGRVLGAVPSSTWLVAGAVGLGLLVLSQRSSRRRRA